MTEHAKTEEKVGRNAPCPCGSGNKYKHCCIYKEERPRVAHLEEVCGGCGLRLEIDIGKDLMAIVANIMLPLRNFCKDHGSY